MPGSMDPDWIWMPEPPGLSPGARRAPGIEPRELLVQDTEVLQHPTIPVSRCSTGPSFHKAPQHQLHSPQGKERESTSGRGTGGQEPEAEGGLKLAKQP